MISFFSKKSLRKWVEANVEVAKASPGSVQYAHWILEMSRGFLSGFSYPKLVGQKVYRSELQLDRVFFEICSFALFFVGYTHSTESSQEAAEKRMAFFTDYFLKAASLFSKIENPIEVFFYRQDQYGQIQSQSKTNKELLAYCADFLTKEIAILCRTNRLEFSDRLGIFSHVGNMSESMNFDLKITVEEYLSAFCPHFQKSVAEMYPKPSSSPNPVSHISTDGSTRPSTSGDIMELSSKYKVLIDDSLLGPLLARFQEYLAKLDRQVPREIERIEYYGIENKIDFSGLFDTFGAIRIAAGYKLCVMHSRFYPLFYTQEIGGEDLGDSKQFMERFGFRPFKHRPRNFDQFSRLFGTSLLVEDSLLGSIEMSVFFQYINQVYLKTHDVYYEFATIINLRQQLDDYVENIQVGRPNIGPGALEVIQLTAEDLSVISEPGLFPRYQKVGDEWRIFLCVITQYRAIDEYCHVIKSGTLVDVSFRTLVREKHHYAHYD